MGRLETCGICGRAVLELEGQLELLQPYFAGALEDAAAALSGEVHSKCLVGSAHGATWSRWRIDHFSGVRGYRIEQVHDGWTVLVHDRQRSLIALHDGGASIALPRAQPGVSTRLGNGAVVFEREWNVELESASFVGSMQRALISVGEVELLSVVDHLGVRGDMLDPAVLESGRLKFERSLRRYWTPNSISVQLCYEVGVRHEILDAWARV